MGVTDDGTLIVWDLQSLRFKSEDHYRKHYEGVPKRAQQVSNAASYHFTNKPDVPLAHTFFYPR